MRVDLPAPFSPSRAWISPGSTTRSMESLATRSPKRLVIPRSSSFTGDPPCLRAARPPRLHHVVRARGVRGGAPAAPVLPCGTGSLRLARRGDLEGAGDDVL